MWNSALTFSTATGNCWKSTSILHHRAHQLQYECLWQWPSGVLSVLSSPAPGRFPRPAPPAPRDHRTALNLSRCNPCCHAVGPSPTASGTAPDLQTSSPDPPVREAPPLPHRHSCRGGRERVRGKSRCWSSGQQSYCLQFWLASSGSLYDQQHFHLNKSINAKVAPISDQ